MSSSFRPTTMPLAIFALTTKRISLFCNNFVKIHGIWQTCPTHSQQNIKNLKMFTKTIIKDHAHTTINNHTIQDLFHVSKLPIEGSKNHHNFHCHASIKITTPMTIGSTPRLHNITNLYINYMPHMKLLYLVQYLVCSRD